MADSQTQERGLNQPGHLPTSGRMISGIVPRGGDEAKRSSDSRKIRDAFFSVFRGAGSSPDKTRGSGGFDTHSHSDSKKIHLRFSGRSFRRGVQFRSSLLLAVDDESRWRCPRVSGGVPVAADGRHRAPDSFPLVRMLRLKLRSRQSRMDRIVIPGVRSDR